jgi:hypothetical protein
MEEIGKRRLAVAGMAVAGLAYFLVAAFPLQKSLVFEPAWMRSLADAPAAPVKDGAGKEGDRGQAPVPFKLGSRYGYFTSDGRILFAAEAAYGVALAPEGFAAYDRLSEGFTILSPRGAEIAKVAAVGYPFFAAGRRFVIGPDQSTVSELDARGAALWSYQLRSIATAFDACPSLAVFGLMDGSIVGLDPRGKAVLDFAPGGSRIAGVYAVAASPDGRLVGAMTGADRQRLVLLEKRSAAYRVAYHRYLASNYRGPVYMAFTPDGRFLQYESPSGVGSYEVATREQTVVPVAPAGALGQTIRGGSVKVLLAEADGRARLVCGAMPDRRILDAVVTGSPAFVSTSGNALYLGAGDSIARMDLVER